MRAIINKKSYWGRYEFRATAKGRKIYIEIFSNVPYKFETSFEFRSKEELVELSSNLVNSYTGYLGGIFNTKIDDFIESFKYNI